mgnify:CR=1 FL=1
MKQFIAVSILITFSFCTKNISAQKSYNERTLDKYSIIKNSYKFNQQATVIKQNNSFKYYKLPLDNSVCISPQPKYKDNNNATIHSSANNNLIPNKLQPYEIIPKEDKVNDNVH